MHSSRWVCLAAAIAVAACSNDNNGPTGATGRKVVLMSDTTYTQFDTSDAGSEGSEMWFSIQSLGAVVTRMDTIDSTSVANALAGQQVVVIPETENSSNLAADMTPGARLLLKNFVEGGGTMIVTPDDGGRALLDSLFGYTLASGGDTLTYQLQSAAASGTPFAGGPGVIWDNDGTYSTDSASFPAGAKMIYRTTTYVQVAVISEGSGKVIVQGWDWYFAAPHGSQDGGWLEVMRRMLEN